MGYLNYFGHYVNQANDMDVMGFFAFMCMKKKNSYITHFITVINHIPLLSKNLTECLKSPDLPLPATCA